MNWIGSILVLIGDTQPYFLQSNTDRRSFWSGSTNPDSSGLGLSGFGRSRRGWIRPSEGLAALCVWSCMWGVVLLQKLMFPLLLMDRKQTTCPACVCGSSPLWMRSQQVKPPSTWLKHPDTMNGPCTTCQSSGKYCWGGVMSGPSFEALSFSKR